VHGAGIGMWAVDWITARKREDDGSVRV